MPDPRQILSAATDIAGPALASFFKTAFGMSLLAIGLCIAGYFIAADGSMLRGLLAVLTAAVACAIIGFTASWKQALAGGALALLRRQKVAAMLLSVVFDKALGVSDESQAGMRGGQLVQRIERLPLNEAVSKLRMAIIHRIKAAPTGGGLSGMLRRKAEAVLLGYLEQIALTRFRDEANRQGGVDLLKVRNELSATIDDMIIDRIGSAMLKTTLLLAAGAAAISLGAAFGIKQIPL